MGRYYMLRGGEVVEEPDYAKWAKWYADSYEKVRCVVCTELRHGAVTTTFLAMNMTLSHTDPPMLFETRVRGGWMDDQWERYSTLAEAQAGHSAWVARVGAAEKDELPPPGCLSW